MKNEARRPGNIIRAHYSSCGLKKSRTDFFSNLLDASLAASLLNVVPEPERVVAEMARVTTAGGAVSYLFPTPWMDAAAARRFIARHALTGMSAQAITLWAALAHKLEPAAAERLLTTARLANVSTAHNLDGMVCAVVGRKPSDRSSA